jgi:RNA polymerase sigma-70 factor (ECF subfamily)
MDDRDLFKSVIKNRGLFAKIYERYSSKVYKYAFFATNYSREDAEDITSQVFMKLLERIEFVELKEKYDYSILPYLYTIARNLVYKTYSDSSNKVLFTNEDDIVDTFTVDCSPDLLAECSTENILKYISEFDIVAKDIVFLKVCEDMTFEDISQELEMGLSAVKMKYYRALSTVSKIINERNGK